MMEVGPYRVNEDGTLRYNNGSWTEFANLLFVDNPVGTGFSYVDGDSLLRELPEMADQFVAFLEKFFALFPEYVNDELYIAGESYAGQHIPYVAQAILDRNERATEKWNLSGLMIGNGWLGPAQYSSYLQYAYKEGLIRGGTAEAEKVENQQAVCMKEMESIGSSHVSINSCEMILQEILRVTRDNTRPQGECINMYDIRLGDSYPSCGMSWPPDLKDVTPYLRRKDVVHALNINADKKTGWQECNGQVGNTFQAHNSKPAVELLPSLLEKVRIILFSGDRDLICNHMGTEDVINGLYWNGATGMETSPGVTAPKQDWTFEGAPAGIYQEARNLTYILFYNSSHMVPFDYPRRTRDMLDRFMGVNISSIGGSPADSRIDGEKDIETSVGGASNATEIVKDEQQRLDQATWDAYYRSGEAALVVVVIACGVWGFFLWRSRKRMSGYRGLFGDEGRGPVNGFMNGLGKVSGRDIEAADFDEAELDDLARDGDRQRYDVGDDSEDDIAGHSGTRR